MWSLVRAKRDGYAGTNRQCVSDGHNKHTACDGQMPELEQPELPSTLGQLGSLSPSGRPEPPGISIQLEMPCTSGQPESWNMLARVVMLAPSGNMHLVGITSAPFAAA